MFQLRWANLDVGVNVLQYRTQYRREVWGGYDNPGQPNHDGWSWTDWQDVPTVFVNKEERLKGIKSWPTEKQKTATKNG